MEKLDDQSKKSKLADFLYFFPYSLSHLCCEYSTFDLCSQCQSLFPKSLGCAYCLPLNQKIGCCLTSKDIAMPPKAQWPNVRPLSTNAHEIWNYLYSMDIPKNFVMLHFRWGVKFDLIVQKDSKRNLFVMLKNSENKLKKKK